MECDNVEAKQITLGLIRKPNPWSILVQVRDALELSFVSDAEMVFTTLSSTGRKVFNRLKPGHFETVLIDEAAQASEVTTLQALTFGCRRSGP